MQVTWGPGTPGGRGPGHRRAQAGGADAAHAVRESRALGPGGASCRQLCQPCCWAQGAHGWPARTCRADPPSRQPAPQREGQRRGPGARDRACVPGPMQACGEQGWSPGRRPGSNGAVAASRTAVDGCPPPGLRPGSVVAAAGVRLGSFSWGGLPSGCRLHVCCRSIGGRLGCLPLLDVGVELL